MRPQQRSPPSWGRGTSVSIPSTRLVITLIKESRRPAFTKAISANQWRPATCSVASAGSRYCSRGSFPGLRRRRAMRCKVFVPGRTADPGRVQRRGQSLHPSAWHPFGRSADAELLQRAVTASRVLVTADLDLPRLARWLGASVPGLIRYAEGNYREAHSLEWVRPLLATIAPDELELAKLERLMVVVDGPKNWRRWHSI